MIEGIVITALLVAGGLVLGKWLILHVDRMSYRRAELIGRALTIIRE